MKKFSKCVICSGKLKKNIINLGKLPICEDFVEIGKNKKNKFYKTSLNFCPRCITVFQDKIINQRKIFPKSYKYRPRFTNDVINGMKNLSEEFLKKYNYNKNDYVCDIGCSDGSLLNFFKKKMKTIGVEPTFAGKEASKNGHRIIIDYFDNKVALKIKKITEGKLKLITFTNVFAHIVNFKQLIKNLKILINDQTVIIIENHYLGEILKKNQFDSFYSEHPRTYSFKSFQYIAKLLDCEISEVQFPSRYGGNIRVFLNKKINKINKYNVKHKEDYILKSIYKVQKKIENWKKVSSKTLIYFKQKNLRLYGKALPARAIVLINMLKIDSKIMPFVFEKVGSKKIGHYVPGTKIKIVGDDQWINKKIKPEAMVIWGWHIYEEIKKYLNNNGYNKKLYIPLPKFKKIV